MMLLMMGMYECMYMDGEAREARLSFVEPSALFAVIYAWKGSVTMV